MTNKIVFGGIYTENEKLKKHLPIYYNPLNDQKNHFWYPVRVSKDDGTDVIYMIDTYQFEIAYKYQKDYYMMVEFLQSLGTKEDNSWKANEPFNYYYSARVLITEDTIKAFDLVADLSQYKPVYYNESKYYNDRDKISERVLFWQYHNSNSGIYLVKRDAKIDYNNKIDALYYDVINNMRYSVIDDWSVEKLIACEQEAIAVNAKYDVNKVEYVRRINDYAEAMLTKYKKFDENLKKELFHEDRK